MGESSHDARKRGRPPVGATGLHLRLPPDLLAALDAWIERCSEPRPSRPEAIRQILAGALGGHGPSSALPGLVTGRDIF